MTTIALLGAGGKIGYRITENLKESEYRMLYLEVSQEGIAALAQLGLKPTPQEQALKEADVAILAVPDHLIGKIATEIVPQMKSHAMIMCLDAAAPYAGELPVREDFSYFVVHPCHPPFAGDEVDPEARKDFFGGYKAKQHIVCALMQGSERDYVIGADIARRMFAPVMKAHRVSVEHMALLEPALAEIVSATCITIVHEAMQEVIQMGVPAEVAQDFLIGHIRAAIGHIFGFIDADMSDGCKLAIQRAKKTIFQPDWKKVLQKENLLAEIEAITRGVSTEEGA
jgi:hypothetical protein